MSYTFENKSYLLLIDTQKAYQDVYNFDSFRANVKKMLSNARSQNIPIIFVFEVDNEKSKWIPFWEELHGPRKLDKGIPFNFTKPKEGETYFIKHGFDAFFQTGLHTFLQKQNIKTIHFCGLLTGACVLNSLFTSYNYGYRNILVENCCSDKTKKRHDDTIKNYGGYLFIKQKI